MLKYSESFSHQYLYKGAVDNTNNMDHGGGTKHKVALENVLITHTLEIRVFVFL